MISRQFSEDQLADDQLAAELIPAFQLLRGPEQLQKNDAYTPRPLLPPGPWTSSGRVFNYEQWEARDRFRELDAAIARSGDPHDGVSDERVEALIREGFSRLQIARRLHVSLRRVDTVSLGVLMPRPPESFVLSEVTAVAC